MVRRCFGVNEGMFLSGMGKDRRAREGRWVSCNCHALNRFGRRFIPSTPKKGQQTATMHCQPGARAVTLPTAGMGERALRCARARVVFFWRRHSVSGIRCGAWRPGLFVINRPSPHTNTNTEQKAIKCWQWPCCHVARSAGGCGSAPTGVRSAAMRAIVVRLAGSPSREPRAVRTKKRKKPARSLESRKQATHDTCSHSQYGHRHPRWHTSVVLPPRVTR